MWTLLVLGVPSYGSAILLQGPSANKGREALADWPAAYPATRVSSNRLLDGAPVVSSSGVLRTSTTSPLPKVSAQSGDGRDPATIT